MTGARLASPGLGRGSLYWAWTTVLLSASIAWRASSPLSSPARRGRPSQVSITHWLACCRATRWFETTLSRRWVLQQLLRRPSRALEQLPSTVRASSRQLAVRALGAEGALEGANPGPCGFRRKVDIAAFAVRAELQHVSGSAWEWRRQEATKRRRCSRLVNRVRGRSRHLAGCMCDVQRSSEPERGGGRRLCAGFCVTSALGAPAPLCQHLPVVQVRTPARWRAQCPRSCR